MKAESEEQREALPGLESMDEMLEESRWSWQHLESKFNNEERIRLLRSQSRLRRGSGRVDPVEASPLGDMADDGGVESGIDSELSWGRQVYATVKEVLFFAVLVLMVGCFRSAVADWNQVPSGSMKPSILEGDRIFVNKLAYDLKIPFTRIRLKRWASPLRGDIVVFFRPGGKDLRLVKRVVGLEGDRIELRGNELFVNGKKADYVPIDKKLHRVAKLEHLRVEGLAMESLGPHVYPVMKSPDGSLLSSFGPKVVPAGHIFAMGDNRDNSADSRVFGTVDEDLIVGQATLVVLSWSPRGLMDLRWDRLLEALP